MMATNGWVGSRGQAIHYLTVVGADMNPQKTGFILDGSGRIWSLLGMTGDNAEIVIDGDVDYFINGKRCNLAAGLRATSYGTRITVI